MYSSCEKDAEHAAAMAHKNRWSLVWRVQRVCFDHSFETTFVLNDGSFPCSVSRLKATSNASSARLIPTIDHQILAHDKTIRFSPTIKLPSSDARNATAVRCGSDRQLVLIRLVRCRIYPFKYKIRPFKYKIHPFKYKIHHFKCKIHHFQSIIHHV